MIRPAGSASENAQAISSETISELTAAVRALRTAINKNTEQAVGAQKGTRTRTGRDCNDFQTVSNGLDHEAKPMHSWGTQFSNGFK